MNEKPVNPYRNAPRQRSPQSGFSLIELLMVMVIMMVIAAAAVPNYMAGRARANEASAAASVRAIITAQSLYRNTFGVYTDLAALGGDYLTDNRLAAGSKSGYIFEAAPGAGSQASMEFSVQATPQLSIGPSASGNRSYYGDESAVIRFSQSGAADSTSPPMQ
jgi:prepilin-type N-terminal cleavage/methylation domain-containing protein